MVTKMVKQAFNTFSNSILNSTLAISKSLGPKTIATFLTRDLGASNNCSLLVQVKVNSNNKLG
jgi:hypothetical protein